MAEISHGVKRLNSDFCDIVRLQIESRLPSLVHGVDYTATTLCGEGFWSLLEGGERNAAGSCIAYLVEHGHLPLIQVKRRHEYPLRYQLK